MTQDQANAIAEREYPQSWGPSPGGISIDHNHRVRKAYAKALMDMNPLIEAGEKMREALGDIGYEAEEGMPITDESACIKNSERAEARWMNALSNLTKSIEP